MEFSSACIYFLIEIRGKAAGWEWGGRPCWRPEERKGSNCRREWDNESHREIQQDFQAAMRAMRFVITNLKWDQTTAWAQRQRRRIDGWKQGWGFPDEYQARGLWVMITFLLWLHLPLGTAFVWRTWVMWWHADLVLPGSDRRSILREVRAPLFPAPPHSSLLRTLHCGGGRRYPSEAERESLV